MSILLNANGVTIHGTYYPAGSVGLRMRSNKVNFIHLYSLTDLMGDDVDYTTIINEATGSPFSTPDELEASFKESFSNGGGNGLGVAHFVPVITQQPVNVATIQHQPWEAVCHFDYFGDDVPILEWWGSIDGIEFKYKSVYTTNVLSKIAETGDTGFYRLSIIYKNGIIYSDIIQVIVGV